MPRFTKTRVVHSDVGRYTKKDTGTEGKPQRKSALMTDTRVKAGGVSHHHVQGQKKGSTRLRSTRVTK